MSQSGQKPTSLMIHKKIPQPKTKKIFFHCKLKDLVSYRVL